MTIRTLTGRARILAALGVTSLALVAASPANAIYGGYEAGSDESPTTTRTAENTNETEPVDENGKKSCWAKGDYHPHGTTWTQTWTNSDGKVITDTLRCNDGRWEPVDFTSSSDSYHYDASTAAP